MHKKTVVDFKEFGQRLIFDNALVVFSGFFLMFSELEMGGIFKKQ